MSGVMVIACFRPKPGKEDALVTLVKEHAPALRTEGLVGDTPVIAGRAVDGAIVEVFTWKSQNAIDEAHSNPRVKAMWDEFEKACDYIAIADIEEAKGLFSSFEPIDL